MNDAPRIALVTGATTGFGALTAGELVRRGLRVFGTSRRALPDRAGVEMIVLDVDDDVSVERCIAEIERRAGGIDVLVNNAGRAMVGASEETTAEEARALFETNVFGVMRVTNRVLPGMRSRRRGTIVNVGSVSGFIGVPFHGVYAASKHALAGYSEALRLEVEAHAVRVVLVEPSAHRTGIQMIRARQPLAIYDARRELVEQIIRGQIDRGPDPGNVARAIVRAALAHRPPFRVRVGGRAVFGNVARRLLPLRVFEWLLRREFQLGGRTAVR
jgi:NADP-dependent 3-hydroxy acid dehydrogenase YdfG